jgi:hypothetical protein
MTEYSDTGFAYLGKLLASLGYIVTSGQASQKVRQALARRQSIADAVMILLSRRHCISTVPITAISIHHGGYMISRGRIGSSQTLGRRLEEMNSVR